MNDDDVMSVEEYIAQSGYEDYEEYCAVEGLYYTFQECIASGRHFNCYDDSDKVEKFCNNCGCKEY